MNSGNLALSVYPEHENSLVVINGGCDCAAVDTSMVKRAPRTIHSRRLSAIRVAVFVIVSVVVFMATYQISVAASAPTYDLIETMNLQSVRVKQGETLWELLRRTMSMGYRLRIWSPPLEIGTTSTPRCSNRVKRFWSPILRSHPASTHLRCSGLSYMHCISERMLLCGALNAVERTRGLLIRACRK